MEAAEDLVKVATSKEENVYKYAKPVKYATYSPESVCLNFIFSMKDFDGGYM